MLSVVCYIYSWSILDGQVMAPTTFSLTCFRLKPHEYDPDHGNNLNAALEEAVNSSGSILMTHTVCMLFGWSLKTKTKVKIR